MDQQALGTKTEPIYVMLLVLFPCLFSNCSPSCLPSPSKSAETRLPAGRPTMLPECDVQGAHCRPDSFSSQPIK